MTIKGAEIIEVYQRLEQDIFDDFIKRLKAKGITKDNVLQWQIQRLNDLGVLNQETIKRAAKAANVAESKLKDLIIDSGIKIADQADEEFSSALGVPIAPKGNIKEVLDSYYNQTWKELDNNVNQTLLTTNFGKSTVTKTYQDIINRTTVQVFAGSKTFQKALNDSIYKAIDKGLTSGLVDKGGRHWRLETYVRTVMNTTAHRTYQDIRLKRGKEYGITTAVMSSHPASRYWCSFIQGRVVEMDKKKRGNGYPNIWDYEYHEPAGTQGINCGHRLSVFIPGVSENHEQQYDPKEAQANMVIQQKQRALERSIRSDKNKLLIAKKLDDTPKITQFQNQISAKQSAIRHLIQGNDFLQRDYAREKVYANEKQINAQKSSFLDDRYKGYVKKFGKHGLPSLSEFKTMMIANNDTAQLFKNYIHARNTRYIEPVADFKLYREVDQQLNDQLDSLVTKNGQSITSHSYHVIDRAIGTRYEQKRKVKRVGIPISAIKNALINGKVKHDEERNTTMYNTSRVSVRVSDQTGKIITVIPKGKGDE